MKLLINALVKFIFGILIVALLIFLPAGTLNFLNGWIFLVVLFIPILILGIVLFVKSPKLLEKRKKLSGTGSRSKRWREKSLFLRM